MRLSKQQSKMQYESMVSINYHQSSKYKPHQIPTLKFKVPTLFQKRIPRTFQGQNSMFQALSNHYLAYCKSIILQWHNLLYTKLQYSPFIFQLYPTRLLQYSLYNPKCIMETWIARSIVTEIWWQNYRILLFFSNQMFKMHKENSQTDRRCSNYIWVINNFIDYKGVTSTDL